MSCGVTRTRLALRRLLPPHAALEDVVHSKLASDLLDRLVGLPVLLGAGAGDDAECGDHGEPAGDLLGDAVREVAVLGRAQILERQHRDPRRLAPIRLLSLETEREQERRRRDGAQAEQRGRAAARSARGPPAAAAA